jgi:predicted RNase H-like HicB family nuclease
MQRGATKTSIWDDVGGRFHDPLGAFGEGETEDEAISDLKEAIRGYIETFGLEDALARLSSPSAIRQIDWNLAELVHG